MRVSAAIVLVALTAAALLPAAQAMPHPAYLFLRDMQIPNDPQAPCTPTPHGVPVGDGELTTTPPCPLNLVAPQNNTGPQTRLIFPAAEQVHPTQFIMLNQSLNTGRIYGPVIVLLYAPESPTVQSGNLSVQLVDLPKTYSVTDVGATGRILANATIDLTYHNTTLPEPTSLVPPDPTNVTAAEGYLAAQLVAYGLTQLGKAQYLMYLDDQVKDHIIDKMVDKDDKLALRFSLIPSNAPAPIPLGLPVAQGAGEPIAYNFALTPALVYVPWYAADPVVTPPPGPNPTPQPTPQPCDLCNPPPPGSSSTTGDKKSGAPEDVFVMSVLVAAAIVTRRRA